MFTSNARQSAARQAAAAAKHEAADAFVALDDTQKSITMVVDAFAGLDAGVAGTRLRNELAPLAGAGDTAAQGWIDALDAHGSALEHDDVEVRTLAAAESAFRSAKSAMDTARTQLEAFGTRHSDIEGRVQAAWAQVSPKTTAAQQALAAARQAVAQVAATGVRSTDLETRLARAEQLGKPIAEGPHQHGVAATLQFCVEAIAAANQVTTAAQTLRTLAGDTQRRLGSTKTRLEGVAARLEQVPPTLSSLRRRFSAGCSDDLDQIPGQATGAIEAARGCLTRANGHAGAGQWEAAASDLEQCRHHVTVAEAGVNAVVQRLRDLDAVAADPAQEKSRTRFVVRDAQTLVVSAGAKVPANEVRILDSLAARLDAVDAKLEGTHPDYWGFLVELRAINEVANAVVRRTRSALAAGR